MSGPNSPAESSASELAGRFRERYRHGRSGYPAERRIEASRNEKAFAAGLGALKPRGILAPIGVGGMMSLLQDQIVARELEARGSFRFDDEFGLAGALIVSGRADVRSLVTQEYDLVDAADAFDIASDRTRAMKVQLVFTGGEGR